MIQIHVIKRKAYVVFIGIHIVKAGGEVELTHKG